MYLLRRSNRLESLVEALANEIDARGGNPIQAPLVVVGTRGMERWVRESLAAQRGICANVRFVMPSGLLDEVSPRDAASSRPWRSEALRWELLSYFAGRAAGPQPGGLRALSTIDAGWWSFASVMGSHLERLAHHRVDWLEPLRAGEVPDDLDDWGHADWFVPLAQQLLSDRGGPLRFERLADVRAPERVSSIHLFGLSALSRSLLSVLGPLSDLMPTCVYSLEPTLALLDDPSAYPRLGRRVVRSGTAHPMLAASGAQTRTVQVAFAERDDALVDDLWCWSQAPEPTLLQRVQDDLLDGLSADELTARRSSEQLIAAENDTSIRIVACTDPRRQVEELRDRLLQRFATQPGLGARHVLVMTPDMETFGPLVRAVFEQASGGEGAPPVIPVTIASRIADVSPPLSEALLFVNELAQGRTTGEAALRWLRLRAVSSRFGFDDAAQSSFRIWLEQTNTRWGLDTEDRTSVAQGLGSVASLQSAVERLAFGAVLPPGLELEGHPIPAGMVEGMRLSLLGSFTEALDLLGGIIRGLRGGPMPVASWCEIANELVDALAAKTDAAEAQQLRETLAGLQREGGRQGDAAPALEVNLVVWAAMLSERLTARRSDEVRGGGGITLASLVPMRAIPFRVVVLLGLDGQLFPRVARRDSVDPMRAKPRRGDPDARDEDRHLFLEALCAAREAFWVFCSAVDADSGEKLPLSAPVDELLDTLDATIECNGGVSVRSLLLEEAQQEPRIPAVEPPAQDDPPPPAAPDNIEPSLQRTITVRNLYRAVAEPLSEYASTTLRIRSEGCDPLPEAEPSVFSPREKSSLTRELLLRAVREPGLEVEELKRQTREHLLRQGAVAQGNLGRVAMASLFAAAQHPILALRAEQIRESAGEPEIIDVGGGTMLTVPQPWRDPNGDPVLVVPRLERGRYRLEIWVNLLCNAAAFNDTCLRVYGPDLTKNATAGGRWHRFEVPDRAEERLAALATMRAVALGRPFRASVETLLADSVITSAKDQHEDPDLVNLLLEVAAEHADAARASKGEGYDKKLSYASPPELLAVLDAPWPRLSETEGEGATVWDADALRWMTEVGLPLVRTLRVEPTKSKKGGKP